MLLQHLLEVSARVTGGMLRHLFRSSRHHDLAAFISPIGSEINDPVGTTDHIEVVLDYPHNSRPNPANAAALLRHEDAATSAAGACDLDSNGADATAE